MQNSSNKFRSYSWQKCRPISV